MFGAFFMEGSRMKGKRYFVTAEEMKCYDSHTIQHFGVPSLVLMERAALAAAEEIMARTRTGQRVLVVAGCGNNGGDGIAVGRLLRERGYRVEVCLIGAREKCSEETKKQLQIIEKYGCPVQSKIKDAEYDIIVDALFGIGLSREVEGIYAQAIADINAKEAYVCAMDIPSGINADTGAVMGIAVEAALTVTFAFEKLGHILYPGCTYAGEVVCREIGITKESFLGNEPRVFSYKEKAQQLLPERSLGGNKGTFGKVLVIAGSVNMSGACELCARSAYRIGAGMVRVVTPEENRVIIQQNIPEALLTTYQIKQSEADFEKATQKKVLQAFEWADCIAIGPGLGKSMEAKSLLTWAITKTKKPLVIDADGINLLAQTEELKSYLTEQYAKGELPERALIMTPHVGEFAGLYGCSAAEAKQAAMDKTKKLAEQYGCVMVCKDARTIIACCGREKIYINTNGNDGMATAGMGDVLTGIIAGLLAQGMPPNEAAAVGVYIHAAAGDLAAKKWGRYALMAGNVTDAIGEPTGNIGKVREIE